MFSLKFFIFAMKVIYMSQGHEANAKHSAIVNYVLHQIHVKTNVCSLQKVETGYVLNRRRVLDYNFIFVTRGRVIWQVDGCDYPLGNGDIIRVPPNVMHQAWSLTKRVTLASFHVEARLPGGQDVFALLNPPMMQSVVQSSRLDFYLRGAMEEYERPTFEDTYATLKHWSALMVPEYIRYHDALGLLKPRSVDPLVNTVLAYLDQHIHAPMTLKTLSKYAGVSGQHLNRLFKQAIGTTPLLYVSELRLNRAAALLREGQMTIKAIAEAVGFDDPYYFSKKFRKHFGLSPSEYRSSVGSNFPS